LSSNFLILLILIPYCVIVNKMEGKMDKEKITNGDENICSVCNSQLNDGDLVKDKEVSFCKSCWNKKIINERKVFSIYGFFVVFFLFQMFFYMPALVHETRGFSSLTHIVLCVIIGTLCGMIAYEEVYARMSRKIRP